jgi:hypothetical protein
MDVEQLHIVLQQSFSAEAAVRNPAEAIIKNLKNLPGAVVLLLQVAAEKQVRNVNKGIARIIEESEAIDFSFYILYSISFSPNVSSHLTHHYLSFPQRTTSAFFNTGPI